MSRQRRISWWTAGSRRVGRSMLLRAWMGGFAPYSSAIQMASWCSLMRVSVADDIVVWLLIYPECIKPDDVIDAEIILRSVALDIAVPGVINPFPGDGKQGRILLHDGVS